MKDRYENEVDVPLGRLYYQAQKILESENRQTFLENKTLDYMVVYDEIPYSGVDFSCSPKTWVKSKVYQDLKDILSVNVPRIKTKGTKYLRSDESKYYEIETEVSDEDLQVNFQYSDEWPMFMEVVSHPKNEVLRGEPYTTENPIAKYLAPLFCLNSYNFVYDIKYPVLISLSKNDFVFQYALLVVIDNNQPRENKIAIDQSYDDASIICENPGKEIKIHTLAAREDGSLIPLQDAKISYECVSSVCDIGATNKDASLVAKFPQCLNGMLIAEKEGYHGTREEISTNQEQSVTMILEPYYALTLNIRIIDGSAIRNISKNEQVVFLLEEPDKGYETAVTKDSEKVRLISGNYHVTSYIIQESRAGGFKIEGKEVETCVETPKKSILGFLGATTKECKTIKLDDYLMEQAITGGVEFDFSIDRKDLARGKTITLYTIREGLPSNTDELMGLHERIKQNVDNKFKVPEIR
ncbi:hypothetical protein HYT58_03120 [Candidatus Woesearchaeota archaeon]|nr:hypothetical protein [Candidatus Woesearchaeota archaeon]